MGKSPTSLFFAHDLLKNRKPRKTFLVQFILKIHNGILVRTVRESVDVAVVAAVLVPVPHVGGPCVYAVITPEQTIYYHFLSDTVQKGQ